MTTDEAFSFTVATYNIHGCVGRDGRKDPGRIAKVLEELSCDIIGLQEVESYGAPGGALHQLDYLARLGGYRSIGGPTMERDEGQYGNALLTRAHIREVSLHRFEPTRWEPRGAIEARLEIGGRPVRAIVTHLGLRRAERRAQIGRLVDIVGTDEDATTVLLGDFNEWFPWARARGRLPEWFSQAPNLATFPSHRPLLALDQIRVRPASALSSIELIRNPLSRVASDHLPLRASVTLEP